MLTRPFRTGALSLAPVVLLALAGCKNDEPNIDSDIALRRISNCGQLRDYAQDAVLEQLIQSRYGYWYGPMAEGDASADDSGGESDGASSPTDYTGTNNQEAGVDEVDIVKTDGNFIYAAEGTQLHIVKSWPIADTSLEASVELGGWPYGLFLHEDTVVAFTYFYDDQGFTDRYWGGTRVTYIDVSDRSAPEITRTVDFEGWMADGRLIEDRAFLVLNTWLPLPQEAWELVWNENIELPEMDWSGTEEEQEAIRDQARDILRPHVADIVADLDISELLPLYRDQAAGGAEADAEPLVECSDVYRPANTSHYSMMSVVQLDLDSGDIDATGLLSDGWTMYASKENLYVAQSSWWWWWGWGENDMKTHIHKFDLTGEQPEYAAAGEVDGWLLNQFSMSEYEGNLRVASTETDWWWGTGQTDEGGSLVTVLEDDGDGDLAEIGKVDGIAPGEMITGVRMMGDIGYVVTFLWVDPLFTVDLSDPTEPTVRGELKIPGFSTYLHPLDEDHVISVGYAGEDDGTITGFAVNVFDVSDLDNPTLAHQFTLESDDWSWSEALWDHHAFTYHRDVLSVPVYTYDYDDTSSWYGFSGLLVLSVTKDGISELGRVDHSDLVPASDCDWGYYYGEGDVAESDSETEPASDCYWYATMRRSVYVEDNVFSLSNYGIKVNDLNAPQTEYARVLFHPAAQ